MRCEGFRRYGGAFTLGPPVWEQCKEEAVVQLTIEQGGEVKLFPACMICWNEAIDRGIGILASRPIQAGGPIECQRSTSG